MHRDPVSPCGLRVDLQLISLRGEGGEEEDLRISSHDKWLFSVFFVTSAFINLYKMLWILDCLYFELILLLLAVTSLWLLLKAIAR